MSTPGASGPSSGSCSSRPVPPAPRGSWGRPRRARRGTAAARGRGAAVGLVAAVGRRLPGPLFDAVVTRGGGAVGEVVPIQGVDGVIEPRQVPCPCPPELLHAPPGR